MKKTPKSMEALNHDKAGLGTPFMSLRPKAYQKQTNRETIAREAVRVLSVSDDMDDAQNTEAPPPIDEDWFNVFERYAEDASSDKMQKLWAKVLAGEIRKPKSFSLKTIRFISELDQEIAQLAELKAPLVLNGNFIPMLQKTETYELQDLLKLEEAGLITGSSAYFRNSLNLGSGLATIKYGKTKLLIEGPEGSTLPLQCVLLTRTGIEIFRMLENLPSESDLQAISQRLTISSLISSIHVLEGASFKEVWRKKV